MEKCLGWSKKELIALIVTYKQFSELWDPECESFKDKQKRRFAWQSIACSVKREEHEVTRKINILRTQFFQEYRKVQNKVTCGYVDATSTWEFYEKLKFILALIVSQPVPKLKNDKINKQVRNNEDTGGNAVYKKVGELSQYFQKSATPPTIINEHLQHQKNNKRKKRSRSSFIPSEHTQNHKIRKKCDINFIESKDTSLVENISKVLTRLCDENQIFGDFVASELRNIINPDIRRKLKLAVQKAIIQHSVLDNGDSSDQDSYTKPSRFNLG